MRYYGVATTTRCGFGSKTHVRLDNLAPVYDCLMYVCGRALRPDIGLKVVYAVRQQGIDVTEVSPNAYKMDSLARILDGEARSDLERSLCWYASRARS